MFQLAVAEKITTHFLCPVTLFYFRKWYLLYNNVGKYCRVGQGTDDSMTHAHCMLDT